MKRFVYIIVTVMLFLHMVSAEGSVRIQRTSGDVRIRRGLDENWLIAGPGIVLEDIDTILSGEASEAVLRLPDGSRFILGGNAILDVGDLREITERELLLYLTSLKLHDIQRTGDMPAIRLENVSVVRGEQKSTGHEPESQTEPSAQYRQELNGARALHRHRLLPNAIIKYYSIMEKYPSVGHVAEIHFALGQAFEAMNDTGHAMDAYQQAIDTSGDGEKTGGRRAEQMIREAEKAIQRLRQPDNN